MAKDNNLILVIIQIFFVENYKNIEQNNQHFFTFSWFFSRLDVFSQCVTGSETEGSFMHRDASRWVNEHKAITDDSCAKCSDHIKCKPI